MSFKQNTFRPPLNYMLNTLYLARFRCKYTTNSVFAQGNFQGIQEFFFAFEKMPEQARTRAVFQI